MTAKIYHFPEPEDPEVLTDGPEPNRRRPPRSRIVCSRKNPALGRCPFATSNILWSARVTPSFVLGTVAGRIIASWRSW